MLCNITTDTIAHVKFISYTGRYPNLCSGVLTLEVNEKEYKFGHDYRNPNWRNENNFESFWSSGGRCGFTNNYSESYVNTREWNIDVSKLPDELKLYAAEIDEVFNSNVTYGCCGGCL